MNQEVLTKSIKEYLDGKSDKRDLDNIVAQAISYIEALRLWSTERNDMFLNRTKVINEPNNT